MGEQTTDLITTVLSAAEGEIVGRIRVQKIFYLLEQLGAETDLKFSYYHYGPYSDELSDALDCAKADQVLNETVHQTGEGFYSTYHLNNASDVPPNALGKLDWTSLSNNVAAMKKRSSSVLEIAATIHWLQHKEEIQEWEKELKIRKPTKATDERIREALGLLKELGLAA
jgi:uncharacterized protein YwgA